MHFILPVRLGESVWRALSGCELEGERMLDFPADHYFLF